MKLLIEPVIDGVIHGPAIQSKKFSLDLEVNNRSNTPTSAFTITRLKMKSSEGQDISEDFANKSFHVDILNPDETRVIKIGDTGQPMHGLVCIELNAAAPENGTQIEFLQKNPYTGEETVVGTNHWVDFFNIKSTNNHLQEKTNDWVIRLTLVTAFLATIQVLPILKDIYDYFST